MRLKILLYTKDKDYGNAICDCVRKMNVNVAVSLGNEKTKEAEYDFALFDCGEPQNISIPWGYLTDNIEDKRENAIYKYDRLSSIINKIICIYEEETGMKAGISLNNHKSYIYTVLSAYGGIGCTSIAMGIAKDCALAGGEDVLYISTGTLNEEMLFAENKEGLTLKDYLYNLLYGNGKSYGNIDQYLITNEYGISTFNMISEENQLNKLDDSEFSVFVKSLVELNRFHKIIFDCGNTFSRCMEYLVSNSHGNICITKGEENPIEKAIKENLYKGEKNIIFVENFCYRGNPKFDEFFESENKVSDFIDVAIAEDKEAFTNILGLQDIEINGEFGKGIREIVTKLNI